MGNTLRPRKYSDYLLEMPSRNKSIMDKYGMPRIAKPPEQSGDIVERVITKPEKWNAR